jgi:hypothetical protein
VPSQDLQARGASRRAAVSIAKVAGAAAISATATLGGLAIVGGATPAGALGPPSTVPPVTNYTETCSVLGIISFPVTVSTFVTAPGGTQAGHSVDMHAFRSTVSIPASFVDLGISILGLSSLSGQVTTVDINTTNTTNGTVNATPTPVPFSVALTEGQPATFTVPNTPATVGPWTAGSSGTITYTPGDVDLSVSALGLSIPVTCAAPSPAPALATTVIH